MAREDWPNSLLEKVCSGVDLPEFKEKGGDVVTDESIKEKPEEENTNVDEFEKVVAAVSICSLSI